MVSGEVSHAPAGRGTRNRIGRRQVLQALILGALLVGLAFVERPPSNGLSAKSSSSEEHAPASERVEPQSQPSVSPAVHSLDELRTLPSYQDLRLALKDYDRARAELLSAAAVADEQRTLKAMHEYRQAMDHIQTDWQRVKCLISPDEFSDVQSELAQSRPDGDELRGLLR